MKVKDMLMSVYTVAVAVFGVAVVTVSLALGNLIKPIMVFVVPTYMEYLSYFAKRLWQCFFMMFAPRTTYVFSGDTLDLKNKKTRSIMLFNHQTFLDWGFIWSFMKYFDMDGQVCIMLKKSLSNVPLLGSAMRNCGFCFVDRHWETDQKNFDLFMENSFNCTSIPRVLIMFPEGTTRDPNSLKRSQEWAMNENRPHLQYLLLPRSTGLSYLIERVRRDDEMRGYESYICDCTMQFSTYSGELPDDSGEGRVHDVGIPEFSTFLSHKRPLECYIHYTYTSINEIVPDDVMEHEAVKKAVEKWLDERWVEKERQLQHFIDYGEYDESWMINKVIYKHGLKEFIIDIPRWGIPLIIVLGVLRGIFSLLGMIFNRFLDIPVFYTISLFIHHHMGLAITGCVIALLGILLYFYKATLYNTAHSSVS